MNSKECESKDKKVEINPEINMMVFSFDFKFDELEEDNDKVQLDLEKIAKWSGGHYNPDKFAGLIFYMGDDEDEEIDYENPKKGNKKTLLLYDSGNGIITGCEDKDKAVQLLNTISKYLRVDEFEYKITNITANASIDYKIKLTDGFAKYTNCTFRPGTFPCAGIRDEENGTYARVSGKGNISIVGAKSKEDVYKISDKIEKILNDHPEIIKKKDN